MFGLNPWVIIGAAGFLLVAVTGSFFGGKHYSDLSWEASAAKQEASASALYIDALNSNAAGQAAYEALKRQKETQHAEDLDAIAAGAAGFDQRMRNAVARSRGNCPVPGTPGPAGGVAETAPGGDGGRGDVAVASGDRLRDVALKLQADVRFCWGWAAGVGR